MNSLFKHLINILKGMAIGAANVIPGFSGGTMAILLNIYDLFVSSFANIFNDFKTPDLSRGILFLSKSFTNKQITIPYKLKSTTFNHNILYDFLEFCSVFDRKFQNDQMYYPRKLTNKWPF